MTEWRSLLAGVFMLLVGCSGDGWRDHQGNALTADDLNGRWAVVNYWAEWCAPCREELPELNDLASARPDLAVLGVNFDGLEGDTLRQLSDDMGIAFPVMGFDFAEAYGLPRPQVLPTTYLLDVQGRIARTLVGPQSKTDLLTALAEEQTP
jgi:thiol-disulfide isomerase/thioredoxin